MAKSRRSARGVWRRGHKISKRTEGGAKDVPKTEEVKHVLPTHPHADLPGGGVRIVLDLDDLARALHDGLTWEKFFAPWNFKPEVLTRFRRIANEGT